MIHMFWRSDIIKRMIVVVMISMAGTDPVLMFCKQL